MRKYKYSWTKHYAVSAQVAGPIIQRCGSAVKVLAAAREKTNPLHKLFEWEDSKAAEQYRLIQARKIVNSLQVEIVSSRREPQHVIAFIQKLDKTGFVPTLEASPIELSAAERKCWAQMQTFKAKWKNLRFARHVIDAINNTTTVE